MKIRKNDTVLVIAGKDKGKRGKVRKALPIDEKVVVEGVNMIKRHSKTKGQARQAGIIELESPIPVASVMLICNKCDKPARVGMRVLQDGRRARFCRVCQEVLE
ncbi:MAG TPA: 50S ribosomal protein L24 [Dehalococcoidia bacterium]|nr:50S ribosomal protein L24 [Dehalococcoidia bacterium]